jgi:hypothetical protein
MGLRAIQLHNFPDFRWFREMACLSICERPNSSG